MNMVAIMQGRLLPPIGGRIQAFPAGSWEKEFKLAQSAGIEGIEWIVDGTDWSSNPLFCEDGRRRCAELRDATRIDVPCVCADSLMELPLAGNTRREIEYRIDMLARLLECCAACGIPRMDLPFVDNSAIHDDEEFARVVTALRRVEPSARADRITLCIESSLTPSRLCDLVRAVGSEQVQLNFDSGNSASLGYDPIEEIELIGQWIKTVHVKDRLRGGGTVPLGSGSADLPTVFRCLAKAGYEGPFVLQAARTGDGVKAAASNARLVRALWAAAGAAEEGMAPST